MTTPVATRTAVRRALLSSWAAAFLLLIVQPAQAQTVTVDVRASTAVRTVDERIFGVNAVIWDPEVASAQTQQLVRDAGIRIIRVPGGSLSNVYHWSTNTSDGQTWKWSSGFDKLSQLILGANTQAFVSVNYGTGTPEEAAAWVAYANAETTGTDVAIGTDVKGTDWKTSHYWASLRAASPLATDDGYNFLRIARAEPIGIAHWEIGNENYGDWEEDQQAVAHDPATYGTRAVQYMAKMRSVDPAIEVGVVAVRSGEYNGWTRTLLTTLKDAGATPDFLIYHRYDQAPGAETDAGLLQSAKSWGDDAANLRQLLTDNLGADAAQVELMVTENNSVYTNPGKQSTSLVNGLFLADSVGNLLQTEFNALTWWDLRNASPIDQSTRELLGNMSSSLYGWRAFGDYGMLSTPGTTSSAVQLATSYYDKYPTYYAMKLLSYFARGRDQVVSTTSSNPLLAVYAVKRDSESSLRLLVINKSPTSRLTGNFDIEGFTAPAVANMYSYGIPNDDAAKPNGTGCPDISGATLTVSGAVTVAFEPYSINVVTLGGDALPIVTGPPTITTQPAAGTVTSGQSASFSVKAAACKTPTYQWQRQAAGTTTWTDVANATDSSVSVTNTTTAMSGDQFRVVVSNADGSATSTAATLTVNAAPTPPTTGGGNTGGGGGGGGAFSWLLLALAGLRARHFRRTAR